MAQEQVLGPQAKGADRDYKLFMFDTDGVVVGSFTVAAALAAVIWAGDDTAVLATPAVQWLDPAQGLLKLTVSAGNLAPLDPAAKYKLAVTVAEAGRIFTAFDGYIAVDPAPGVALPGPVYCEFGDMLTYYAAIGQLQSASDRAGFAEARARARTWLDDLILTKYRPGGTRYLNGGRSYHLSTGTTLGRSKFLADHLADDHLMVTPAIREIAAKMAIGIVCKAQIGADGKRTGYQDVGEQFAREAEALALGYSAEMDYDGDGQVDDAINLSVTVIG